jgi:SAM-dependent methyltransferase
VTHARLDAKVQSARLCTFRLVALAIVLAGSATALFAQDRPRHGRLFPPEELGVLEGPDRDAWQMPDAVMDALGIADGSAVADIGAGGGWFTVRLARRVGPNGIVYAQDVQSQMIEAIRRRVDRDGLNNVRIVRGDELDPRLPVESVDAILIVDSSEFRHRVEVLRHLGPALRAGGRIGLVEYKKVGGGPGPPQDERVDESSMIGDAERAGLRLIRKETFLPFQYFLVLGRPSGPAETR